MTATSHYHDRITRATERLAQLQAKELLANQRSAAKAKETTRREELKRHRVADLVFLAGAHSLDDSELLDALSKHMQRRSTEDH